MNFPLYIARRYLFAKKNHNVINLISAISVGGIALASFALICTLSVFNGFHSLIDNLFSAFDPELKVVPVHGKFFDTDDKRIQTAGTLPFVELYSFSLEEQALLQYRSQQQIAMIKGVDENFHDLADIESILFGNGIYMLSDEVCNYGIMGVNLLRKMDCGTQPANPITIYVPKKGGSVSLVNPTSSFNSAQVFSPGVFFKVDQEKYDDNYIIVSLDMARRITGHYNRASAMELRIRKGTGIHKAKSELKSVLGENFMILDRYQQQADVFKVVKLEKYISYLFLSFILLIACFNIISSLIMHMIDKKDDTVLLKNLGAEEKTVERIFTVNGILISVVGAFIGLTAGIVAVLLQYHFGIIKLGSAGNFIVDAYPVRLQISDILIVLLTVIAVCAISIHPIGRIARKFIGKQKTI